VLLIRLLDLPPCFFPLWPTECGHQPVSGSNIDILTSPISLLLYSPLALAVSAAVAPTSSAWPQQWRSRLGQATSGGPLSGLDEELDSGRSQQAAAGRHRESFQYASRRKATHFCTFSLLECKVHLCFALGEAILHLP
jgi:hypothetical protein